MIAQVGLGRRGEDRRWQGVAVDQAGGQRDATDLAAGLVVEQPRAGQVATGDALDGEHVELLADNGPPGNCLGDVA